MTTSVRFFLSHDFSARRDTHIDKFSTGVSLVVSRVILA